MKIINKPRCGGKTTQMIFTSEATDIPIVVLNYQRKQYIMEIAERINCIIPEPITINDLRNKSKMFGKYYSNDILIDEGKEIIEAALKEYTGKNVVAVTMTV